MLTQCIGTDSVASMDNSGVVTAPVNSRRSDGLSSQGKRSLAMISASDATARGDRSLLVSEASNAIFEGLSKRYSKTAQYGAIRLEEIALGIPTLSDATLRSILSMRGDPDFRLHCEVIEFAIDGSRTSDEAFVSDYLSLSHCFTTPEHWKRTVEVVLAFASFEFYEGMTPQREDFSCPKQRVDQCTAIITTTKKLREAYKKLYEVHKDDVIDYFPLSREQFSGNRHGRFRYVVKDSGKTTVHTVSDNMLCTILTAHGTDLAGIANVISEQYLTNIRDILEMKNVSPAPAINSGIL